MEHSFEAVMTELCAPTLARVKPASLFRFTPQSPAGLRQSVAHWDAALHERGVSVRILKECPRTGAALVYVYRPGWLEQIVSQPSVRAFLREQGYHVPAGASPLRPLLTQLTERLCCQEEFPHEIGIFLGYPLTDVQGFIRNRGAGYTCYGYWKVYGDAEQAKKCFARYKKCEQVYKRMYQKGTPISKLTVAA